MPGRRKKPAYPNAVCQRCGSAASRRTHGVAKQMTNSTWHIAKCDVCGEKRAVTEPRDFYYPFGADFIPPKKKTTKPK